MFHRYDKNNDKIKLNMKKTFKYLVSALCAVMVLATTVMAADPAPTATNGPVVVQTVQASDSFFNAKEFGLSLSTGYALDRANLFKDAYSVNLEAGAFYFPFRYFGAEVNVPFYSTKGVAVQEVQWGLLARLPLSKSVPVLKSIAPYVGVGGVYNWDTAQDWAYIAKAGVDVRFNSKWGIFVEGQYRNYEVSNWGQGQTSLQSGIKFAF